MEMMSITVAGRELPMGFDLKAWVNDLEPKFGSLTQMSERLNGQDKPITAGIDMLTMVVNAGARMNGSKEKISREWLIDNIKPAEVAAFIGMGQMAIMASFRQENADAEEPVDEVLAEIEKKEPADA